MNKEVKKKDNGVPSDVNAVFGKMFAASAAAALEWLFRLGDGAHEFCAPREGRVFTDGYLPITMSFSDRLDGLPVDMCGKTLRFVRRSPSGRVGVIMPPAETLCDALDIAAALGGFYVADCGEKTYVGDVLPMHAAPAAYVMRCADFPGVTVELPSWYCSIVKVISADRAAAVRVADVISASWGSYTDLDRGIVAADMYGRHNGVKRTVRVDGATNIIYLILTTDCDIGREVPLIPAATGLMELSGEFTPDEEVFEEFDSIVNAVAEGLRPPDGYERFYAEAAARAGNNSKAAARAAVCYTALDAARKVIESEAVFETPLLLAGFLRSLGFEYI